MVKSQEYSKYQNEQLKALRFIGKQLERAVDRIEAIQEEIRGKI